jgi:Domain of unknown function (DUF4114)/Alpha-L-fucosidase
MLGFDIASLESPWFYWLIINPHQQGALNSTTLIMNLPNLNGSPLDLNPSSDFSTGLSPVTLRNEAAATLGSVVPSGASPIVHFDQPSSNLLAANLPNPEPNPLVTFNPPPPSDGIFFVGSTGEIVVDFLADSGLYHSQVALFSLTGMESMTKGSNEFINTALTRALSNSNQGRLIIDDFTEGAKITASLGETNFNDGAYQGSKKFSFNPGDRLGMLMVSNATLAEALQDLSKNRPLFSMADANIQQVKQFGQLRSNVFGWEDIAGGGDRDYNDLVLSLGNVSGAAIEAKTLMTSANQWYNLSSAQPLFIEPSSLVFDNIAEFTASGYGLNIGYLPCLTIPAAPDGTWNDTINSFDVAAFVADVAETGAAYVIFSVGQTSGYYAAPNQTYLAITGTKPGQYVPQRDLVQEIAQGLKKIGVATLVYVAAEGPTAAPAQIINSFPLRSDRADDPDFRSRFNQVIQEWSQRWGSDIAGWWIDGAWVNGYTNEVDGRTNLNALIAAAKSGNSQALVAVNPGSGNYISLTDQQDFLAGENTVFDRLPDATSKGPAWHSISYLGATWSEPSADRYTNQQLINYVRNVNRGKGVVTMDVAVNAQGRLSVAQLAQLAAVKTAIR